MELRAVGPVYSRRGIHRYCLVDSLDEATVLAERFSREEPEPGPYYIIEVLRHHPVRDEIA